MQYKYPNSLFKNVGISVHKYEFILGKIVACLDELTNISVLPIFRNELLKSKNASGIYSVLAWEGSEISLEQIEQIEAGNTLPAGKNFLEVKVKKMLHARKDLFKEIVVENKAPEVTPERIKKLHASVVPKTEKWEGLTYTKEQDEWLLKFSEWCRSEIVPIHPEPEVKGILKAILIHAYFEWMQPLETSNKQTSELLELATLLESGIPYLASQVLLVYYYETRTEHQRRIELVKNEENLNEFLGYALQGFCDGLVDLVRTLQAQQFIITWQHYINTTLNSDEKASAKVTARRMDLMHVFPLNTEGGLSFEEVLVLNPSIARLYAKSAKMARRDLAALLELGLLCKKKTKYYPNVTAILGEMALKSSLIKLEQVAARKEIKYSHHVLPRVGSVELKSELLQIIGNLTGEE